MENTSRLSEEIPIDTSKLNHWKPDVKPEPKPQEPRELPKLKQVDKVKDSSPVRRSQSPDLPQLKHVEQQKKAESPARAQSPIPKLKQVPKKRTDSETKAAPEKVRKHC